MSSDDPAGGAQRPLSGLVGGGRGWFVPLAAVVLVGVVVRAVYVLVVLDGVEPGLDAIWYQLQGGSIREGRGYVVPRSLFSEDHVATAAFPPLYPLYQAAWQLLVGTGPDTIRLAGLVPAAVTIWLTALLGRRIWGPRVGLVAAGLIALHPGSISADGSAMSESLTVPLALTAQLLALRIVDATGRRVEAGTAMALGAVLGLAVLTRQDLVLLAVPLVVWVVIALPGERPDRVVVAVAVVLAASVVVAPWVWRNHRTLDVVAVSTISPTSALAGANCESTYQGSNIGSWDYDCVVAARPDEATEDDLEALGITESQLMASYQDAAFAHARENASRLPVVAAAREARAWSIWHPADLARRDAEESRRYGWQLVSRPIEAVFALVGALGLFTLARRHHRATFVLWAPILAVVVSVAVGYGNPRFNVVAQPSLAIGVACLAAMWCGSMSRRSDPDAEPDT